MAQLPKLLAVVSVTVQLPLFLKVPVCQEIKAHRTPGGTRVEKSVRETFFLLTFRSAAYLKSALRERGGTWVTKMFSKVRIIALLGHKQSQRM